MNELEILYYAQKTSSYFELVEKFGFKNLGELIDFLNKYCKKYGFIGVLPLKIPASTWQQIVKDLGGDINQYPPLQPEIKPPAPPPPTPPRPTTLSNQQLLDLLYMAQQTSSLNELCEKFGICAMTDLMNVLNGFLRKYKIFAILPLNIPHHIWQQIVRDLGGDINKYPAIYREPKPLIRRKVRYSYFATAEEQEREEARAIIKHDIKENILNKLPDRPKFLLFSDLETLLARYNISPSDLLAILIEMEEDGMIEIDKSQGVIKIFKGINPKKLEGTIYEVLIPYIHEAQKILNIPVELIEPTEYTKISSCYGTICYIFLREREFDKIYISTATRETEEELVYEFHRAIGRAIQYHFPEYARKIQEAIRQMSEEERARVLGEMYRYPIKNDPNGEFFEAGAEAYAIFRTNRIKLPPNIQNIIETEIMTKMQVILPPVIQFTNTS